MSTAVSDTTKPTTTDVVETKETKLWYGILARAGVSLLFAIVVISDPWMRVGRLATVFGVYALVDAALALFCSERIRRTHTVARGQTLAVEAGISAFVGVLALLLPPFAALRILGGLRALGLGSADVAWSWRGNTNNLLELSGFADIIFGIIVLAWPGPGLLALPWLLGITAMVSGALALAGTLSRFTSDEGTLAPTTAATPA
jgi:uncharacterized membrane protein HdeD (DUF308 family)